MTIVIAGYCFEPDISIESFVVDIDRKQLDKTHVNEMTATHDLFFVADSAISTSTGNNRPDRQVMDSYKKVINLPVRIYEPYIVNRYFRDYKYLFVEYGAVIAFAGNTTFASHAISQIQAHLSELRIARVPDPVHRFRNTFALRMACDKKNNLFYSATPTHWNDDEWPQYDENTLFEVDELADIIKHAIDRAIITTRNNQQDWELVHQTYNAYFVAGLTCPKTKNNILYYYDYEIINEDMSANSLITNMKSRYRRVAQGEIVILGMPSKLSEAEAIRDQELTNGKSPENGIFNYVVNLVDEYKAAGAVTISRPVSLYQFRSWRRGAELLRNE